jgi:transcriptional regulator of arginine metabolism
MSTTAARRRLIRELLITPGITSQQRLVALLEARGHRVTQATVSRDLQALGAVKDDNGYAIVAAPAADSPGPARALNDLALSLQASGNLVVIHTPPGAAQLLAAVLDSYPVAGLIGTVAGDDTVLAVAATADGGINLKHQLERIGEHA